VTQEDSRVVTPQDHWLREGLLLLPNLVKLIGRLLLDPRVPTPSKAFLLVTLGYVVSPVDVLPDVIPFVGQLDELLLISLGLHYLIRSVGPEIVLEYWDGSDELLDVITNVVDVGATLVPRPVRRFLRRLVGPKDGAHRRPAG
jgi:uncharacterized membrane protein YkvA (DUF1232 family)